MKFLSKRMTRQKVNGNGIRAAGNPDEEPVLSRFPICPPVSMRGPYKARIISSSNSNSATIVSGGTNPHRTRGKAKKQAKVPAVTLGTAATAAVNAQFAAPPKESAVPVSRSSSSSNHPNLQASFPLKLQRILDKLEADGNTDIVSWLSHGRAFQVHDADRFVSELMPVYFNQV